jgi:outer membrane lipoprotein-sorting protein
MLTRRALLASSVLMPAAPALAALEPLSPQAQADIARVETYLNGLKTLKARFFQVAGDGGTSQGVAWLDRPGRMRFQYDPPSPFLLIAAHGVLTFNDSSLQQTSNIPLSRTPLGILLAESVTLSGDVTVTNVQRLPGQVQVTLVRTASPGDGSLTLIFADGPMTLKQWIVVDAQRRETHVTLSDPRLGGTFDPALFEQLSPPAARNG